MTSIFNILASQAFGTLIKKLTKTVLFVMSLPLIYVVHNCWGTEKPVQVKEIRQADKDWVREVHHAEQERERERETERSLPHRSGMHERSYQGSAGMEVRISLPKVGTE